MAFVKSEMIIDLDRDIVRSNVLVEALLGHFKKKPFLVFFLLLKMIFAKNPARIIAERLSIDPASLLYHQGKLSELANKTNTAAPFKAFSNLPEPWSGTILRHLPMLDDIAVGQNKAISEAGTAKPAANPQLFWHALRALRPHQWAKNILVFVPLILSHRIGNHESLIASLIAFLCFSFTASGIYILNDLMDLSQDRKHPVKCNRPFASGALSIGAGFILLLFCIAGAVSLATFLPEGFSVVLALYVTMNLAYIFYFKSKLLVDVLLLASAYTLRILGGERAIDVDLSFWLLAFSTFLFLSLALVKRYVELDTIEEEDGADKNHVMGRGYRKGDLDMLSQLGVASGFSAVLVLALYVDSAGRLGLYKTPEFIWLVCPIVLYVIGRIWVLAKRRELPDDPVLFIIKDWRSHIMGVIVIGIMVAAKTVGYTF